jgi:serine/threonine-protein kinase ULK4
MVLEYAAGGTLYNKIRFGYGGLPKDKVKRYFRDVCRAVEYLHSLKYMHRDIKVPAWHIQPENILLTHDDHTKLCDFGFAAIL